MSLETVAKMVAQARVLLQDTVVEYRYSDADILASLNIGLVEIRTIRPDAFLETPNDVPEYDTVNTDEIELDQQMRLPLLYFIVGYSQLRDEEDTSDARAAAFMQTFRQKLTGQVT